MWRRSWTLLYCARCRGTTRHSVSVAGMVCEECAKVEPVWTDHPVLEVRAIDGDSLSVRYRVHENEVTDKPLDLRLLAIDAPELHKPLQHAAAMKVRDLVATWLIQFHDLRIKVFSSVRDKYGRPMIQIYGLNGPMLNDYLLANKLAYPYGGGAKRDWTADELGLILNFKG